MTYYKIFRCFGNYFMKLLYRTFNNFHILINYKLTIIIFLEKKVFKPYEWARRVGHENRSLRPQKLSLDLKNPEGPKKLRYPTVILCKPTLFKSKKNLWSKKTYFNIKCVG